MMKTFKYIAALSVAIACLAFQAQANLINISINPNTGQPATDVNKGFYGNNNPTTNFNALVQQIGLYENFHSTNLPDAIFTDFFTSSSRTVSVTGFDYAVVHYGKGPGGTGQGGGIEFFSLNGLTGNFTFPANGLGPNGKGGFSGVRLFKGQLPSVPDGGATVALLGFALGGLGAMRRFLKR